MSALDAIVTSPPLLEPRMPTASSPVVTMLNGPVATLTATLPSLMKATPTVARGRRDVGRQADDVERREQDGRAVVSSSTPVDTLPEQVTIVPPPLI